MKREFGVKQIGFFVLMFIIEDDGFYYKNKRYSWLDIVTIKRDDNILMALFLRHPSSAILINDGTMVIIPAIIEERHRKDNNKYIYYDKYNELIDIIATKMGQNNEKFYKYLVTSNYIILYRWLIAASIFTLSMEYFVFNFKDTKIDSNPYQMVILLVVGIFMLVKRRINKTAVLKELQKQQFPRENKNGVCH